MCDDAPSFGVFKSKKAPFKKTIFLIGYTIFLIWCLFALEYTEAWHLRDVWPLHISTFLYVSGIVL